MSGEIEERINETLRSLRAALDAQTRRVAQLEAEKADLINAWPTDSEGNLLDASAVQDYVPKLTRVENGGLPYCAACGARLP